MIQALSLTAAPEASARPTLQEAAVKGISWFFTNLSPAFAWCIPALAVCVAFGFPWRRSAPSTAA